MIHATGQHTRLDSRELLKNHGMPKNSATPLNIPFDPAMLTWQRPDSPRDGIWRETLVHTTSTNPPVFITLSPQTDPFPDNGAPPRKNVNPIRQLYHMPLKDE